MIDESGLEATLDWYIPSVERQTGIEISYEKSGVPISVEGAAATHIYRVVQEALTNIVKHARQPSNAAKSGIALPILLRGAHRG